MRRITGVWMVPVVAMLAGCNAAARNEPDAEQRARQLEQRVEELEQKLLEQAANKPPTTEPLAGEHLSAAPDPTPPPRAAPPAPAQARPATRPPEAKPRAAAPPEPAPVATAPEDEDEPEARQIADATEVTERATSQPPPAPRLTVPSGTRLTLRLETALSSTGSLEGDEVTARVEEALSDDGRISLPRGTTLTGFVSEAVPSGRVKGRARLSVTFDRIVVNGRSQPLDATTVSVEAQGAADRDAKVVGGSTVAGALLGGIADGGKGARRGAIIGAVAGAGAVLATKGHEIEIEAGARWTVTTRQATRF